MMDTKNTREKIVKAMFDLIAEQGYEKASIGKIAEVVGIKKASIYYYYSKKEEILFDVIREYIDDNPFDYRFSELAHYDDYKKYILEFGLNIINQYESSSTLRKVCAEIQLLCSRNEAVKEKMSSIEETHRILFEHYFEQGVKIKVLPEDFEVEVNSQLVNIVFAGIDSMLTNGIDCDTKGIWVHLIDKIL